MSRRTWAFNNHVAELRGQIARSNDPFNGTFTPDKRGSESTP